jgi:enoyl-CoA hydratase
MQLAHVLYAVADRIASITVNRPDKLNALNDAVMADLDAAFAAAAADPAVGVVILSGSGEKAFVAGADIGELAKQTVIGGKEKSLRGQKVLNRIEHLGKPVIAAINGYAFGGGLELALACHLRYAASTAKVGLPECGLGIIPGYGGTQRLPRIVGRGRALEMILSGAPIDAATAERWGLVNAVFEPADFAAKVRGVAAGLLTRGPLAMAMAMEAVLRGTSTSQEEGLRIECDLFGIVSSTADMREGLTAFLEKRKPAYKAQ